MELSEIFFLIGDYIIERGIFYPKVKVKIPWKKKEKTFSYHLFVGP